VIKDAMNWCEDVTGHKGACLFEDILDLLPNGTLDPDWTYSEKLQATTGVTTARFGSCVTHDSHCFVNKTAVFDVSGLPCPDMSRAGKRRKRAGVTNSVYLAHGRYVTLNRMPLQLTECTPDSRIHWDNFVLSLFVDFSH